MSEIPTTSGERPGVEAYTIPDSLLLALEKGRLQELLENPEAPLTIDDLPDELINSDKVKKCAEIWGWPTVEVDGDIKRHQYESDTDFWDAFILNHKGAQGEKRYPLNNFIEWLKVTPVGIPDEANRAHRSMSGHEFSPALNRAWALYPELFRGLQEIYAANDPRNVYFSDDELRNVPTTSPQFVAMTYMAYQLIARLVATQDAQLKVEQAMPGFRGVEPTITSATDHLQV